jgi:hypothetical protein
LIGAGFHPKPARRQSVWSKVIVAENKAENEAKSGRVIWINVVTVVSAAVLIGTEIIGAGYATGWALAGLFGIGDVGGYALSGLFSLAALFATALFLRNAVRIEPLVERSAASAKS